MREGKDAAGKALESEFYYLPDLDDDEMRRQAVVNDLRKPGLRNCRKQHKVRATVPSYGCGLFPLYMKLTDLFYSNTTGKNPNNEYILCTTLMNQSRLPSSSDPLPAGLPSCHIFETRFIIVRVYRIALRGLGPSCITFRF